MSICRFYAASSSGGFKGRRYTTPARVAHCCLPARHVALASRAFPVGKRSRRDESLPKTRGAQVKRDNTRRPHCSRRENGPHCAVVTSNGPISPFRREKLMGQGAHHFEGSLCQPPVSP